MHPGTNNDPLAGFATDPQLRALEAALRQHQPLALNLDRDRLMFLAGQASVSAASNSRASRWFWPASTLAMTGLAACLALALCLQNEGPPIERIVVREAPVPAAPHGDPPDGPTRVVEGNPDVPAPLKRQVASIPVGITLPSESVLQMRNTALRWGVEALPHVHVSATTASALPTSIDLWNELREKAPALPNPESSL